MHSDGPRLALFIFGTNRDRLLSAGLPVLLVGLSLNCKGVSDVNSSYQDFLSYNWSHDPLTKTGAGHWDWTGPDLVKQMDTSLLMFMVSLHLIGLVMEFHKALYLGRSSLLRPVSTRKHSSASRNKYSQLRWRPSAVFIHETRWTLLKSCPVYLLLPDWPFLKSLLSGSQNDSLKKPPVKPKMRQLEFRQEYAIIPIDLSPLRVPV